MDRPLVVSVKERAIEERKLPDSDGAKVLESYYPKEDAPDLAEKEADRGADQEQQAEIEDTSFFGKLASRISSLFKKK